MSNQGWLDVKVDDTLLTHDDQIYSITTQHNILRQALLKVYCDLQDAKVSRDTMQFIRDTLTHSPHEEAKWLLFPVIPTARIKEVLTTILTKCDTIEESYADLLAAVREPQ